MPLYINSWETEFKDLPEAVNSSSNNTRINLANNNDKLFPVHHKKIYSMSWHSYTCKIKKKDMENSIYFCKTELMYGQHSHLLF